MSIYKITFSDGSDSLMTIEGSSTVEEEISKWGPTLLRPVDATLPLGTQQEVTVISFELISN